MILRWISLAKDTDQLVNYRDRTFISRLFQVHNPFRLTEALRDPRKDYSVVVSYPVLVEIYIRYDPAALHDSFIDA